MSLFSQIFRLKNIEKITPDNPHSESKMNRILTTLDLTILGIGCTMGSGVYILTGSVAKYSAGPAVVICYFIAALASILSGLCYCEFGARVPKAGSAYVYTYVSLGEFPAFMIGWNLILEYSIGSASVIRSLVAYIDNISHSALSNIINSSVKFEPLGIDFDVWSLILAFLVGLLFLGGLKGLKYINGACTVINLLLLVVVVISGSFYADLRNWEVFAPYGIIGIIKGSGKCFFAFVGFDAIATMSEEAKDPIRSLPLAIIYTILICFVAYFSSSAVLTLMVPYYEMDTSAAFLEAYNSVGSVWGKYVVSIGAIIGLLGCLLVSLMPLPRILYAMANDGLLGKPLSWISTKNSLPYVATIISTVFTAILASLFSLDELVEILSIGTLVAYSMVALSILLLHYESDYIESEKTSMSSDVSNINDSSINGTEVFKKLLAFQLPWIVQSRSNKTTEKISRTLSITLATSILFLAATIIRVCPEVTNHIASLIALITIVVLSVIIGFCLFALSRLPRSLISLSTQQFRCPLVPILPATALFINVILILSLNYMTWLKVIGWMVIGIITYFSYSMSHSNEAVKTD